MRTARPHSKHSAVSNLGGAFERDMVPFVASSVGTPQICMLPGFNVDSFGASSGVS